MHKTAIVILNWNGIGFLQKFLANVIEHSENQHVKIYVADNGSTDGSAQWVETNHKNVGLIKLEKNHGFAGGYNLALEQVEAEYYVLLNSDVEVTPGWLVPLISFLDDNPSAASCQPKILSFGSREKFEYAGAAGGFIDKYGFPFCRGRIFHNVEKDEGQYDSPTDVFWSSGACMAVRASAWKKCGGFDASFFAHMEEIDLCWRFARAGYRVACIPDSVVYHVGGGALPYNSPFKTYLNFRNSLFLLHKNLDNRHMKSILFKRKIFDGIAALSFLLKGRWSMVKSVWKAHMDYYRSIDELEKKRDFAKKLGKGDYSAPILNKSIVLEFYARGRKTFRSLNMIY